MRIFALADLHLSENSDKPMDLFGPRWAEHNLRIKEEWGKSVAKDDVVLVPGDISWAMYLAEALADLEYIHRLPGQKILLKGNHDYWWQSLNKVKQAVIDMGFDSIHFMQNNAFTLGEDFAVCGTRLWLLPDDQRYKQSDEKILKRELIRMKLSLDEAKALGAERKLIFMSHYPPLNKSLEDTEITRMLQEYGVSEVIFGHIHNSDSPYCISNYCQNGIRYNLVAGDYLRFKPLLIAETDNERKK